MTDGKEGGEDTGTVTFTDVPLATNDVQSMEEDSGTTTGNVLTNEPQFGIRAQKKDKKRSPKLLK